MKVLHIIATPRGARSHTLPVAHAYLDALRSARPGVEVEEINLYRHDLPAVAGSNIKAKYMLLAGQPMDEEAATSWHQIEELVADFLSADHYLVTAPMWNLSIPYALKYYIDCIVQPGYLFRYGPDGGVVPLVHDRSMVCVTSRGADYAPGRPYATYDFQEPYLRAIFGFVGITDVRFVNAQPMDFGPELRAVATNAAMETARSLVGAGPGAAPDAEVTAAQGPDDLVAAR